MRRFIEQHTDQPFDVIVIGGGITGASVAYEAATRGLRVALIDKRDFSSATSSASSKLIHGGLRYLVNGEIAMVRESLRERRVMGNIAPNFVYPMPMLMEHTHRPLKNNKWVVKLGMLAYDALSYDKNFTWDASKKIPTHRTISREEVLEREPRVRIEGLTGASVFYDCVSIFPERLTLAFLKSAIAFGAEVSNYAEVRSFSRDAQGKIVGVVVKDLLTDREHTLAGKVVVNCAGPWADIVLGLASSDGKPSRTLRRSEGIHIITDKPLISGKHILGAVTPTGTHFFVIPWRGQTLIGTTDKPYTGDPDEYRVTKTSLLELLEAVNHTFGEGTLTYADVRHCYGGLRPLVEDQTKETYTSSRRYEIRDNAQDGLDGLISVEGGKFTTSRNLAEHCLELVGKKLDRSLGKSITDKTPLSVCAIPDLAAYLETARRDNADFSAATVDYLSRTYGTEYADVLALARADASLAETLDADGELLAQVTYAIREEMALHLSDILFRRTGIGTLGHPGDDVLRKVAALAARELGWDEARTTRELALATAQLTVPDA
jgi:glycerol-3-phosphate dehydrogenase